ncbi:MAG: RidA family protein, partial [Nitrospinae bacterium]|nr:RidA family protein [Nitrospinota bacterium]
MSIEKRLEELGIELPEVPPAVANYIPGVAVGEVLFLAGTIGQYNGEIPIRGKLGDGVTVEEGYQSARLCGLNHFAMAKHCLGGDLDRIVRAVRLEGYVNSAPG